MTISTQKDVALEYKLWPSGHLHRPPSVRSIEDGSQPPCCCECCGEPSTHYSQIKIGAVPMIAHLTFCTEHASMLEAVANLPNLQELNHPPEVEGSLTTDGLCVSVLCPFCGLRHTHDLPDEPISESTQLHRQPHCPSDFLPFAMGGYVIKLGDEDMEAYNDGL